MKRRLLLWGMIAAGVSLSACESSNEEIVTMFLAPHKAACGQDDLCLVVRNEDDDAYRLLDAIEGFRFHWGYGYELRVEVKHDATFAGPRIRYVMKDVEASDEAPLGTTFQMCMTASMLRQVNLERNRGWIGLEQREFEFTEEQEALVMAFQEKGFGLATFTFHEDVEDPMILTDLAVDLEAPCEGPIPEYVPEPDPGSEETAP